MEKEKDGDKSGEMGNSNINSPLAGNPLENIILLGEGKNHGYRFV